jgi:hypothetical protein
MATGKVTVQAKALLKLPKELPSNIVSINKEENYVLLLLKHLKPKHQLCTNT